MRDADGGITGVVAGVDGVGGGTDTALADWGCADPCYGSGGGSEDPDEGVVGRGGHCAGLEGAKLIEVAEKTVIDAGLIDVLIEDLLDGTVGDVASFDDSVAKDFVLEGEVGLHDVGLTEVGIDEIDAAKGAGDGGSEGGGGGRCWQRKTVAGADVTAGGLVGEDRNGLGEAGRGAIGIDGGAAGNAVVKNAPGGADGSLAALERRPGETETGSEVVVVVLVPGVGAGDDEIGKTI